MSYAAIPTTNRSGTKPLPGMKGLSCCGAPRRRLSGLGDAATDKSNYSGLLSASVDPNVALQLIRLGATQNEIDAIIADPDSQDQAVALLSQLSAAATISANATPTGAVASGMPAIPVGSYLTYTATYTTGLTTWSVDSAVSKVRAWLAENYPQLSVVGYTSNSNLLTAPTMILTLQVVGGGGFASANDVKLILDSAITSTQSGLQSSSIAIGSGPAASATPAAAAESIGTWLGNNWYWFALAGVGVLGYRIVKRMV